MERSAGHRMDFLACQLVQQNGDAAAISKEMEALVKVTETEKALPVTGSVANSVIEVNPQK